MILLIRPKAKARYVRTEVFSLSDLLKWLLASPFLFVAAVVMRFIEEAVAAFLVAIPGLIFAYYVAEGDIVVMWGLVKEHWEVPVYGVLALASIFKALHTVNKSNKKYD